MIVLIMFLKAINCDIKKVKPIVHNIYKQGVTNKRAEIILSSIF